MRNGVMNISDLIKSVMTFDGDASQLRSSQEDGHWHDSDQFHEENKDLIVDYVDCRSSQLAK